MLAEWIVGGLDVRFHGAGLMITSVHLAGQIATCAGYGLFLWAMASNAYFTNVVRIQTDRGHQVQSGGPYRWVRHPGYSGTILAMLATPFLLGSGWALVPAVCSTGLFFLRTALEDRTLRAELPGYEEFTRRTRFRIIPGIW
jgi:protein-S-isoprenylcysteine O-methyltransferase Ste14